MKTLARTSRSLLVLTALALTPVHATPEFVPQDDAGLADFIRMTYSADERLSEEGIDVTVRQGIATLTGRVATLDQAERAVERTKSVEGIRGVLSHLKVTASRAGDGRLAAEISQRLATSPGLGASSIKVGVHDQLAILEGQVGTWDEQEIARELASEVPGIATIDNRLEAVGDGSRGDQAIRWQIERDFHDDPLNDGLNVSVSVSGGHVRLTGEVGTGGEKDLLVRRAQVAGVTRVSASGVEIVRSLSMEGMTGKTPGPGAIREALLATLAHDKRLRGAAISTDLGGRRLTLTGTVPTTEMKTTAESTARGVPGVEIVVNRLVVADDRRVAAIEAGR